MVGCQRADIDDCASPQEFGREIVSIDACHKARGWVVTQRETFTMWREDNNPLAVVLVTR